MLRQHPRVESNTDLALDGTEYDKADKPAKSKMNFYEKCIFILFVLLSVFVFEFFRPVGVSKELLRSAIESSLSPNTEINPREQQRRVNGIRNEIARAIDPNKERKIILIHVGHSGGTPLRLATASHCWDASAQEDQVSNCLNQYSHEQKFAVQTRDVFYYGSLLNSKNDSPFETATSFAITIRNPIDRVIDAYRSSHPANCHGAARCTNDKHELFAFCFPRGEMEDFAQAVLPNYNVPHFPKQGFTVQQKCDCRALARKTIRGETTAATTASLDMHFHYQHYARHTYQKHRGKELFAIRMEHQQEDLTTLDIAIGGSGEINLPNDPGASEEEKYVPSPLSTVATKKICCVLNEEIFAYFHLFDQALNLTPEDKEEADEKLREQCGLKPENDWDAWRKLCKQRFVEPEWSKCAKPK